MQILNSFIFQLAILSALFYSIGDFLGLLHVNYLLFGLWVSFTPNIGESIQESSKRIFGIASGGFVGFIIMVAFNQNTLSIGLGLALSVLFCYALGIPKAAGQAVVSFCMVGIGFYEQGLNQYYWERFSYNTIGVILGTMAVILIPPPRSAIQLQQGISKILRQIGTLYQTLINRYLNPDLEGKQTIQELDKQVHQTLTNNEKLLNFTIIELSQEIGSPWEKQSLVNQHNLIKEIIILLKDLESISQNQEQNQLAQLLFSEISYLAQNSYQLFQLLANLSEKDSYLKLSNLPEALANLDRKVELLHNTQETNSYDLQTIMEITAFLDNLKAMAHKIDHLAEAQGYFILGLWKK